KLAAFLGMEDAILYSSCFDANGGLFETLLGAEDAIISDALNHREHAIGGDQDMTDSRFTRFFQTSFQFDHVVVGVTETLCFTQ
ncbi:aminotransferase class I/II-fold pyridoxal phosphate-dependent enzyme, partial [Citrobacter braakii]|uniref:aminotransferase class I/II-fold pyridoxal phosphate-dependent enzyme n=1 Tax=Citrobacter braakii TaxID=57706 RepID=UPI00374F84B9